MRKIIIPLSFICLNSTVVTAQTLPPQTEAVRTTSAIKLDGIPDDEAWKQAPLITGFVEMRPRFGRAEDARNKTEVYLLYDDDAIYFGGILHQNSKDSISTQLSGR